MKRSILMLAAALFIGWAVPVAEVAAAQTRTHRSASAGKHRATVHKKAAHKPVKKKAIKKSRKPAAKKRSTKHAFAPM